MSALEVLNPILLRSQTPGPNEKVLKYLEGMSREGEEPDTSPPRSIVDADEFRSRVSARTRSPTVHSPAPLPKSPLIYTNAQDDGDADSNVQDGVRSEMGETILPIREPGPHDPPGPKYESYDSGPSFGNFGPLPSEDMPVRHNGQTPGWAAKVPLPDSEFALSPRGTNADLVQPTSPRAASRVGKETERPWSPMSGRTKGTAYPPLPESRIADDETNFPASPRAKSVARSKAPSISPSDSPSQFRPTPTVISRKTTGRSGIDPAGAEQTPRSGSRLQLFNGAGRSQAPASVMSGSHQTRPFSPYRHAPTTDDLLHAAIRGRSVAIPEESERTPSVAPPPSNRSKAPSQISKAPSHASGKAPSSRASQKAPSAVSSRHTQRPPLSASAGGGDDGDGDMTPRPRSPDEHELEIEARIVRDALTPRTSYYAEPLGPEVANQHHDMELCVLLHQESDPNTHDLVKKALRKAVRQRVKKLGMEYDTEAIKKHKQSYYNHDPSIHLHPAEEPPQWASDIKRELVLMQQRIESLGPKIEELRGPSRSVGNDSRFVFDGDDSTRTPVTQTVNIQTQPADSMYIGATSEVVVDDSHHHHRHHDDDDEYEYDETHGGDTRTLNRSQYALSEPRDDSGGQQFLEEELYKLRQRPQRSRSEGTHRTWEVAREQDLDDFEDEREGRDVPTIPDSGGDGVFENGERASSPPLPALPDEDGEGEGAVTTPQGEWGVVDYAGGSAVAGTGGGDGGGGGAGDLTPWQRIHSRLLSWAVIWPMSELDQALNSTTRGQQVDEIALSIWATQTYKRYVRARMTDNPVGVVDRLFVPPNMADAISNAVFNGQHGNACGMLRDLWAPFGLPGMPRLLVVLAKHRSEADHWVVHRYSLPEGTLITYDSYAGRTLMDGRPLGWWFAIRLAWPNASYPAPSDLEQKMVRLHRPLQLPIDNAVAAAGIWRNILMGSRGERSLDLERLRDLINTEVKNLRQRKMLGRLSVGPTRQPWEHV